MIASIEVWLILSIRSDLLALTIRWSIILVKGTILHSKARTANTWSTWRSRRWPIILHTKDTASFPFANLYWLILILTTRPLSRAPCSTTHLPLASPLLVIIVLRLRLLLAHRHPKVLVLLAGSLKLLLGLLEPLLLLFLGLEIIEEFLCPLYKHRWFILLPSNFLREISDSASSAFFRRCCSESTLRLGSFACFQGKFHIAFLLGFSNCFAARNPILCLN